MKKPILCIVTTTVYVDGTTETETEQIYHDSAGVQAADDTNLDDSGETPPKPPGNP